MQNSKPSIRKITAFHEAAHVVLAVAHEMAVGDVSIVADHTRGSHGTAVVWDPLLGWKRGDGGRRELVDRYVEALYAGRLAEDHFFNIPAVGWTSDEDAASDALRRWPPPGATSTWDDEFFEKYEAKLKVRARRSVAKYEREIAKLASILLKRRTLGGDEAFSIVTGLLARTV